MRAPPSPMSAEPREHPELAFRRRALAEAARYGSDALVFVRELLQNARDAGARTFEIEVERDAASERVICRDDGRGMSYEHAKRYLFALYASSKENEAAEAGKFGIGFWSVLRFAPSRITIRSRASSGEGWQVVIDGDLESLETTLSSQATAGTEVILERPASDIDLSAEILAATRRYGRFVTLRDDPSEMLTLRVDGQSANSPFTLPAPCSKFRRKGFRGVVGLGSEPRVELFAQGLFVRSAASLQDLREAGEPSRSTSAEDALSELPSLAPRVLIDSSEIDLLLARSDARYDKHLQRILNVTERQLRRLITRQLQALRPQPWYRLWWGALSDRLESFFEDLHVGRQTVMVTLLGLVLGMVVVAMFSASGSWRPTPEAPVAQGTEASTAVDAASQSGELAGGSIAEVIPDPGALGPLIGQGRAPLHPLTELGRSYRGPQAGSPNERPTQLALRYEPETEQPFFTVLAIDELTQGEWQGAPTRGRLPVYTGTSCDAECLSVELLAMDSAGGELRVPIPTGHQLDPQSIRVDGVASAVYETVNGEAVLRLERDDAVRLEYRTRQAAASGSLPRSNANATLRLAPQELVEAADSLRQLPPEERVAAALDYVTRRVVYDRSGATEQRFQQRQRDIGYVAAALEVGAGDCDVQNGVLATLLQLSGLDARLALGYVGNGGTVARGLHAWVEYSDGTGPLKIADASVTSSDEHIAIPGMTPTGESWPPQQTEAPAIAEGFPSPAWALAALLLLAGGSLIYWQRRTSGSEIELGEGQDLASLLGGALRHPEAFANLPAMLHGRFVPLVGRTQRLSLSQARKLASDNRLFRSTVGSDLARRAAEGGFPVVDASTPEGRVLSLALGAIDLDHWSELVGRAESSALCQRLDRCCQALAVPWSFRESASMTQPWVEVALDDLRLGQRLIVLDLAHGEFAPAMAHLESLPETAVFTVLDVLLHRMSLDDRERARILSAAARQALPEAAWETGFAETSGDQP